MLEAVQKNKSCFAAADLAEEPKRELLVVNMSLFVLLFL